jgi:hypothetical protein
MDDTTRARAPAEGNGRMLRLLAQSRQGPPQPGHGDIPPGPERGTPDAAQFAQQPACEPKG